MKTRSLIAALLATATSVATAAGAANTLCARDEAVVFQCRAKKELISLCARPGDKAGYGATQLRVGKPQAVPRLVAPITPATFDGLVTAHRFDPMALGGHYLYVELKMKTEESPVLKWSEAGLESAESVAELDVGAGRERITVECTPGTVDFRGLNDILTIAK